MRRLLLRQGVDVPYATLHRFAVAELGFGRTAATIPVADCGPGEELQLDTGWVLWLEPDATTPKRRRVRAWIFTAVRSRHRFVWPHIAAGPTAVWATIGDDPMQLGDGAVGLLRVDRASRTVTFMPVHTRMMIGLHVAGGRPTWTMNGATWQAPEAGGPPEQIHPFVVAATDEQGFYRNIRGSDDDFVVSYQRRGEQTPIFIRGPAWLILPIAGGFIAGFPRIGVSAGLVLDPQTRRFRPGPGVDIDKVAIGCVRW